MRLVHCVAVTALLLFGVPGAVSAQDKPDYDELLRRLQEAESRLKKLEEGKASLSEKSDAADEEKDESDEDKEDPTEKLKEDFEELQEDHEKLSKAWDKFQDAELKKKSDAAKKPTFKIGGRIHADFWDFVNDDGGVGFFENSDPADAAFGQDPNDRFTFRRVRLETKGDILDWGLWRIQVDFNNPGTPEIKDVFLGFKNLPNNQTLLLGNQKRPLGLDHLNSSRMNIFIERPFVVEAFNEDARRPGVAMYGHTDDEKYIWTYGAYFLENISRDGRTIGDSRQMSLNGRIASSPWYDEASGGRGYFHWAISGMAAYPDAGADGRDQNSNEARFRTRPEARSNARWLNTDRIAGADAYYITGFESIVNVGPWQMVGEYQMNSVQRDAGFSDLNFHGGYVYLSYFLTGEHIPYTRTSGTIGRVKPFENFFLVDRCDGGRGTGWGAFNVALRYSYLDISDADVLGGVGESVTLGMNWYWTPYSNLQFNLIYGNIDEHAPVAGVTSSDYLIAGARFRVDF